MATYPKALRDRLIQLYGPVPKVGDTVRMTGHAMENAIGGAFGDFVKGDLASVIEVEPEESPDPGVLRVKWLTNLGNIDPDDRVEYIFPPEYEVVP